MVIVCPLVYIWGFYICMHTTMANLNYEKDGKVFLKCKECGEFKEVNIENWYRHSEGFLWVLWRCKECIKKWRKTEYERWMARERDRVRYKNDDRRREMLWLYNKERKKRHLLENELWELNHLRTDRLIKRLWIRPKICPICWNNWRIVAHHPDIDIWWEIVFCCQPCHDKIHKGIIVDYRVGILPKEMIKIKKHKKGKKRLEIGEKNITTPM